MARTPILEIVSSRVLGAAGEHYVMCQLLRRGFIAALAPVGVPNTDILVTDSAGQKLCAIQAKERHGTGRNGGWIMGAKHEHLISPLLLYCFVDLGAGVGDVPSCWLVPSEVVADVLTRSHRKYLDGQTPERPRQDTSMRKLLPDYGRAGMDIGHNEGWLNQYHDAWHLLRLDSDPDVLKS